MAKIIFFPIVLLALAGCNVAGLGGSGKIVSEERQVPSFANVETGGAFSLEWKSGPPSVTIKVDDNLQQYVEVKVTNNVLHLRTTRDLRPTHSTISVSLTSGALEAAELNGASKLIATQLRGPKFYLESNGASKVTVDGSVDEMIASMNGASKLEAEGLQTKRTQLSVAGAGKADVTATEELKVSIAGAGKVEYGGHPAKVERDITGAGSIRQRE